MFFFISVLLFSLDFFVTLLHSITKVSPKFLGSLNSTSSTIYAIKQLPSNNIISVSDVHDIYIGNGIYVQINTGAFVSYTN